MLHEMAHTPPYMVQPSHFLEFWSAVLTFYEAKLDFNGFDVNHDLVKPFLVNVKFVEEAKVFAAQGPSARTPSPPPVSHSPSASSKSPPPPPKDALGNFQGESLASLRASWPCGDGNPIVVQHFMKSFEAYLINEFLLGPGRVIAKEEGKLPLIPKVEGGKLPLNHDVGLTDIFVDNNRALGANADLFIKASPQRFRLNFIGCVTRSPTIGCFPLCTVFDQKFYMSKDVFGSIDNDIFVPAWLVPQVTTVTTCEPVSEIQSAKRRRTLNSALPSAPPCVILQPSKSEHTFTYTWIHGAKRVDEAVSFTIHSLLFDSASNVTGLAMLKRPLIDEQIKTNVKSPAKSRRSQPCEVQTSSAAAALGLAAASKVTKHLYT